MPTETTAAPTIDAPVLLIDLAETARRLSVSLNTAKRMARDGSLPGVVKVRRRRLVSVEALKRWIAEGCPEASVSASAERATPRRRRPR